MQALPRTASLVALSLTVACSSGDKAGTAGGDSAAPAASLSDAPAVAAGTEPTANDISNYQLDMDKMRRYVQAIRNFTTLSASDSAAASAMDMGSTNESTAQMIARIERNPIAVRELRKAGLTPRDYVWITAAYLQAAMTAGMMEMNPQATLPAGQNPQNVNFMRQNRAAIEQMMQQAGLDARDN